MPLKLPDARFDEIAIDLFMYANSAREAHSAGIVMAARGGWGLGFHHTLEELDRGATMAGQVHQFFKDCTPYEDEIRTFFEALAQRRSAA